VTRVASQPVIERRRTTASPPRPALSVVVPVVDGAATIVENVGVIRRAVEAGVDGDVELVVVSDGSIDATAEVLLASRSDTRARVIHYDRNLGKGYAVRAGSLAARGEWVAFVDSDLDLDPAALPTFLDVARRERLHFAIGSKRHPASSVQYPTSRRVASWCYQQLNRALFRLDVRDTQVGIKLFHRAVAERVMPLLLVKQFAFDLELLAVSRALGYDRVRELPVSLDYRFTGSGVRSVAVARALVDTAAIFYRLRILRTYQRKREMLGFDLERPAERRLPLVSLIGGGAEIAATLDYPRVEVVPGRDPASAVARAGGELVAVLPEEARPAGNWLSAAVAFFRRPDVAAVVVPTMAPRRGTTRELAAAAVLESRLGAGSRRIRFSPGNLRTVTDYPAESIVVRADDLRAATNEGVERESLVAWLAGCGREVVYTPEAMTVVTPAPVFRRHLSAVHGYARSRGVVARRTRGRSISVVRLATLAPFLGLAAAVPLMLVGGAGRTAGLALLLAYLVALAVGAVTGALRFRSVRVGLLALPALAASHVAYAAGFAAGVAAGR
jgi:glycosyltransferase involved in cell wall biosynthesis